MTEVTLSEAYATACEQLGDAQVRLEILGRQLRAVTEERDDAGLRIVALNAELEELRNPSASAREANGDGSPGATPPAERSPRRRSGEGSATATKSG